MNYAKESIPRDAVIESEPYWYTDDILLFVGPRQAGKTTILRQIQARIERHTPSYWITLEDPDFLTLLNESPKNLFRIIPTHQDQKVIVFIDEIQYLDNPTNLLKYLYDEYRDRVKLIVSGSSAFYIDETFQDSLVGRKKIFTVYPLSFREFLRFKNQDDLAGKDFSSLALIEKQTVSELYQEYMTFGGYPRVVLSPMQQKEDELREIAYSYIKKDILEAGIRREETFFKLMKMLADRAGGLVNNAELASTLGVSILTVEKYIHVMRKSFHITMIRPFARNVRSELTKMPKVYWIDLGLRNFLAGSVAPYVVRGDQGTVLENAVARQLITKKSEDEIKFWRTKSGQEIDFVVGENAYEVKVDPTKAKSLSLKAFQKAYPEIAVSIVTADAKELDQIKWQVINAWEL
jgi:predicted AAA+ superfamily ATPase